MWTNAVSQLETLISNISRTETNDVASDTESLFLSSGDECDLLDFDGLDVLPEDDIFSQFDIEVAFGSPLPEEPASISPKRAGMVLSVKPCSSHDYVHGARTYTSKSFNLMLAISVITAYHQNIGTRRPGTLLGEFCGDIALESLILRVMCIEGVVGRRIVVDESGLELIEVSIRRSVLVKLFHYEGNEAGSRRLSEIFMGRTGKPRSSANIRKVWGSLTRDISRSSDGRKRNTPDFVSKIGYRKISAKNCEFVLRLPVVRQTPGLGNNSMGVRI